MEFDEIDDLEYEEYLEYKRNHTKVNDVKGNYYIERYKKTGKEQGCYVATCVYGSYDCKNVWILRRFRDHFLYQHFLGRCFIKTYYLISPKIVKRFGDHKIFRSFNKSILDHWCHYLSNRGYKDTPYKDLF